MDGNAARGAFFRMEKINKYYTVAGADGGGGFL